MIFFWAALFLFCKVVFYDILWDWWKRRRRRRRLRENWGIPEEWDENLQTLLLYLDLTLTQAIRMGWPIVIHEGLIEVKFMLLRSPHNIRLRVLVWEYLSEIERTFFHQPRSQPKEKVNWLKEGF